MAKTTLRSTARCAIIIPFMGNDVDGLVAPGAEINVSAEAMATDFVKNLIATGELVDLGEIEEGEQSLDELRAKCDELGIEHSPRWSRAKLQLEIAKAPKAE